jgi:hypothetical protein
MRDYKRLKRLNESNNDVDDENENNGGYADYGINDDPSPTVETDNTNAATKSTTLYGTIFQLLRIYLFIFFWGGA